MENDGFTTSKNSPEDDPSERRISLYTSVWPEVHYYPIVLSQEFQHLITAVVARYF